MRTEFGARRDSASPVLAARLVSLALGALLLLSAGAHRIAAQQALTSATLAGHVVDENGAALPGATVTATEVETNSRQTAVSDGEGRYRFPHLPVGAYELKAEKADFAPVVVRLTLTLGQALELPLKLSVASVGSSAAARLLYQQCFSLPRSLSSATGDAPPPRGSG